MAPADLAAHELAHGVDRVAARRPLAAGGLLLPRPAPRRGDAEAAPHPGLVVVVVVHAGAGAGATAGRGGRRMRRGLSRGELARVLGGTPWERGGGEGREWERGARKGEKIIGGSD